ncbi:unnamed protein product [Gongylonema pulchrum]|uniref:CAP-ZIP_m domain-containing protein n=1 Tax=Gongylonema pulchrum TaxID=637853 RepID=A0A183CWQ6_9BILA|nr:unnamed protein product [Gongylonema pulchrum]
MTTTPSRKPVRVDVERSKIDRSAALPELAVVGVPAKISAPKVTDRLKKGSKIVPNIEDSEKHIANEEIGSTRTSSKTSSVEKLDSESAIGRSLDYSGLLSKQETSSPDIVMRSESDLSGNTLDELSVQHPEFTLLEQKFEMRDTGGQFSPTSDLEVPSGTEDVHVDEEPQLLGPLPAETALSQLVPEVSVYPPSEKSMDEEADSLSNEVVGTNSAEGSFNKLHETVTEIEKAEPQEMEEIPAQASTELGTLRISTEVQQVPETAGSAELPKEELKNTKMSEENNEEITDHDIAVVTGETKRMSEFENDITTGVAPKSSGPAATTLFEEYLGKTPPRRENVLADEEVEKQISSSAAVNQTKNLEHLEHFGEFTQSTESKVPDQASEKDAESALNAESAVEDQNGLYGWNKPVTAIGNDGVSDENLASSDILLAEPSNFEESGGSNVESSKTNAISESEAEKQVDAAEDIAQFETEEPSIQPDILRDSEDKDQGMQPRGTETEQSATTSFEARVETDQQPVIEHGTEAETKTNQPPVAEYGTEAHFKTDQPTEEFAPTSVIEESSSLSEPISSTLLEKLGAMGTSETKGLDVAQLSAESGEAATHVLSDNGNLEEGNNATTERQGSRFASSLASPPELGVPSSSEEFIFTNKGEEALLSGNEQMAEAELNKSESGTKSTFETTDNAKREASMEDAEKKATEAQMPSASAVFESPKIQLTAKAVQEASLETGSDAKIHETNRNAGVEDGMRAANEKDSTASTEDIQKVEGLSESNCAPAESADPGAARKHEILELNIADLMKTESNLHNEKLSDSNERIESNEFYDQNGNFEAAENARKETEYVEKSSGPKVEPSVEHEINRGDDSESGSALAAPDLVAFVSHPEESDTQKDAAFSSVPEMLSESGFGLSVQADVGRTSQDISTDLSSAAVMEVHSESVEDSESKDASRKETTDVSGHFGQVTSVEPGQRGSEGKLRADEAAVEDQQKQLNEVEGNNSMQNEELVGNIESVSSDRKLAKTITSSDQPPENNELSTASYMTNTEITEKYTDAEIPIKLEKLVVPMTSENIVIDGVTESLEAVTTGVLSRKLEESHRMEDQHKKQDAEAVLETSHTEKPNTPEDAAFKGISEMQPESDAGLKMQTELPRSSQEISSELSSPAVVEAYPEGISDSESKDASRKETLDSEQTDQIALVETGQHSFEGRRSASEVASESQQKQLNETEDDYSMQNVEVAGNIESASSARKLMEINVFSDQPLENDEKNAKSLTTNAENAGTFIEMPIESAPVSLENIITDGVTENFEAIITGVLDSKPEELLGAEEQHIEQNAETVPDLVVLGKLHPQEPNAQKDEAFRGVPAMQPGSDVRLSAQPDLERSLQKEVSPDLSSPVVVGAHSGGVSDSESKDASRKETVDVPKLYDQIASVEKVQHSSDEDHLSADAAALEAQQKQLSGAEAERMQNEELARSIESASSGLEFTQKTISSDQNNKISAENLMKNAKTAEEYAEMGMPMESERLTAAPKSIIDGVTESLEAIIAGIADLKPEDFHGMEENHTKQDAEVPEYSRAEKSLYTVTIPFLDTVNPVSHRISAEKDDVELSVPEHLTEEDTLEETGQGKSGSAPPEVSSERFADEQLLPSVVENSPARMRDVSEETVISGISEYGEVIQEIFLCDSNATAIEEASFIPESSAGTAKQQEQTSPPTNLISKPVLEFHKKREVSEEAGNTKYLGIHEVDKGAAEVESEITRTTGKNELGNELNTFLEQYMGEILQNVVYEIGRALKSESPKEECAKNFEFLETKKFGEDESMPLAYEEFVSRVNSVHEDHSFQSQSTASHTGINDEARKFDSGAHLIHERSATSSEKLVGVEYFVTCLPNGSRQGKDSVFPVKSSAEVEFLGMQEEELSHGKCAVVDSVELTTNGKSVDEIQHLRIVHGLNG